jgi:hypothetical protein
MDVSTPGTMIPPIKMHTGGWETDALEDSGSPLQKSGFAAPTFISLQRTSSNVGKPLKPQIADIKASDESLDRPVLGLLDTVVKTEGWETDALEDSGSPLKRDGYAAHTFSSFKKKLQESQEKPVKKAPEVRLLQDLVELQV